MEYWQIRKAVKECLMAALITAAITGCLFCVYMLRAPKAEAAPSLSGDTFCSMLWDNATEYNDRHGGPGYILLDQDIADAINSMMAINPDPDEGARVLAEAVNGPCATWKGALVSYFQRMGRGSLTIDNNGKVYYPQTAPATKLS